MSKIKPSRSLYFAYGSNLHLRQMRGRCPGSLPVRRCILQGYALEFRGVATIVKRRGSQVQGAIYSITPQDEVNLDRYEGYREGDPANGLYRKMFFKVELDGKVERVMAYVMNRGGVYPPCEGYENTIRTGFANWKLDVSYLDDAVAESIPYAVAADESDLDLDELNADDDDETEEGDPIPRLSDRKGYDPFERWYKVK